MVGRVLFVDDESDLRFIVSSFLEMSGYAVLSAGDADEALRLAQGVPLNVIVLDVNLPGSGSSKLLESLKQTHPNAPVILYTGRHSDDELVKDMLAQGAKRHLLKDGSLETLLATVKELGG